MVNNIKFPQKVVILPFFKIYLCKIKVSKFKEILIKIAEQVAHAFDKNNVGGV